MFFRFCAPQLRLLAPDTLAAVVAMGVVTAGVVVVVDSLPVVVVADLGVVQGEVDSGLEVEVVGVVVVKEDKLTDMCKYNN